MNNFPIRNFTIRNFPIRLPSLPEKQELNVKTHGPLTLYRHADGGEQVHIGKPDAERDAMAATWGWSVIRTEVVSKLDYDALREKLMEYQHIAKADPANRSDWPSWQVGDTVQYLSAGDFVHDRMTVGSHYLIHEAPDDHETMIVLDDDGDELAVLVGEFEWVKPVDKPNPTPQAPTPDRSGQFIDCWNCQSTCSLRNLAEADGQCPHCDAEIDMATSLSTVLQQRDRLAECVKELEQQAEELKRCLMAQSSLSDDDAPSLPNETLELLRNANTEAELVSDEELDQAWGYANFGGRTKREVIRLGTLKCLAGWYQGHTSKTICTELGLIDQDYNVTPKGRAYLWVAFSKGCDF